MNADNKLSHQILDGLLEDLALLGKAGTTNNMGQYSPLVMHAAGNKLSHQVLDGLLKDLALLCKAGTTNNMGQYSP